MCTLKFNFFWKSSYYPPNLVRLSHTTLHVMFTKMRQTVYLLNDIPFFVLFLHLALSFFFLCNNSDFLTCRYQKIIIKIVFCSPCVVWVWVLIFTPIYIKVAPDWDLLIKQWILIDYGRPGPAHTCHSLSDSHQSVLIQESSSQSPTCYQ